MAYTLRNQILVPLVGEYQISDASTGEILYNGRADIMPNETEATPIDIAPIIRQLVKPLPYGNHFMHTTQRIVEGYETKLNIKDSGNVDWQDVVFIWDYNYKYDLSEEDYCYVANEGIQDYVYEGQYFPINVVNVAKYFGVIQLYEEDYNATSGDYGRSFVVDDMVSFFGNAPLNDNIPDGFYVYWGNDNNDDKITRRYQFRKCIPQNTVTLYYINMRGGLSWVHCDCKNIIEENITRNQITHQPSIDDYTKFGLDNYNIQTYKSYTLNTNWLDDEQSMLIQELFKSPRVWLQNYTIEPDTLISVVLTDTKVTHKNKANDKLFNYTIKCRDSKNENIYA